uniref:Poly [ADP-ribose] polymerase n=1 Tax=Mastacembelus armatus TaxID=205130 RepID=A0A7N8WZF9_9TELE
ESQTNEDSDTEENVCGIHSCTTDLHHHPQLDIDTEAVRTLFSDSAVSFRKYASIDGVDVDLNINSNILDEDVARAWRINPSEPIIVRLHFSLSQYLNGPAPSVEVFQPSNTDHFSLGKQLQKHSRFRPSGTIKKFRARLSIWLPLSKYTFEVVVSNLSIFSLHAQIMRYAEQRIPTLNEYCVVCDERHVFQNVFSLLCLAALLSSRKSLIFEPFPSVVDPYNPKTLAFSPKRKRYDRLQKALDSVLLIRKMAQGPYSEIKKQMDKIDPLAYPLLQWILASNRSHIVKLPLNRQLKFMHTPHQFLLISSTPSKEACFQTAKKLYGSTFAFHGSHIENWHSILRNGLINASYTKLQLHGAAYGKGIYLSPISSISFGYSEMGKGEHKMPTKDELIKKHNRINKIKQDLPGQPRFLESRNLNCIALCEVITSKDLQKHGNIWVCPVPDHVCTRFLFVYENGQVGNVHINTQEAVIHREILQVIASKLY